MIAANQVGDGLAFDTDDNALTVYWPGGGRRELARAHKSVVAAALVATIAERHALRAPARRRLPCRSRPARSADMSAVPGR